MKITDVNNVLPVKKPTGYCRRMTTVRFLKIKIFMLIALSQILAGNRFASEDPIILQIRQEYQSIRAALPELTVRSVYFEGYSAEGGEAKAYRDAAGEIRFIRAEFYGESGKAFEEYYYKNGALIFVFRQTHKYNVPFYVTEEQAQEFNIEAFDPKKTRILEDRHYFHDSKMIRWINDEGETVDIKSELFKDKWKQVREFTKEIKAKLK